MSDVLVLGAGPLGRSAAAHLAASGREPVVATRSGTALPGARALAADVLDPAFAERALREVRPAAVVCAVNFPYPRWGRDWPAASRAVLELCRRAEARLVIAGNLYAVAPPTRPIRESDPLDATTRKGRIRALVWEEALAAHERGELEATELRGSDYLGPGAGDGAHAGDRLVRPVLAGGIARPLGDPDAPRSWTAIDDFGRLLARAVDDPRMPGRAWHVPSETATTRELARMIAAAGGVEGEPRLRPVPRTALALAGLALPMMRELGEVLYQFERPFLVDDSNARTILGERSTPLAETAAAIVAAEREPTRA